ncbi:MAG TPA: four helix bundle protein [Acidobacteriota bacterium]
MCHSSYEVTSTFPAEEKYNLVAQMRSAAVSMTSNIAEGFGRFSIGKQPSRTTDGRCRQPVTNDA